MPSDDIVKRLSGFLALVPFSIIKQFLNIGDIVGQFARFKHAERDTVDEPVVEVIADIGK